eukprot:1752549-Prymnesium_polylepis.2
MAFCARAFAFDALLTSRGSITASCAILRCDGAHRARRAHRTYFTSCARLEVGGVGEGAGFAGDGHHRAHLAKVAAHASLASGGTLRRLVSARGAGRACTQVAERRDSARCAG